MRPFFAYVAFNLPHYPEQPDSAFIPFNSKLAEPRKSYAGVVSTVDDKIGQIIQKIEELGLREHTMIIFMSDNGHSTEETMIRIEGHLSGLPKGTNYCANGGGGFQANGEEPKAVFWREAYAYRPSSVTPVTSLKMKAEIRLSAAWIFSLRFAR